jgi:xylulokinase
MALLAIDIGTTHCKAGLFAPDGAALAAAARPTPREQLASGAVVYPHEPLWAAVAAAVAEALAARPGPVVAVGVASMAETGLLADRRSGAPLTPLLPWFDRGAAPYAALLARERPGLAGFGRFGIHPTFKCGLAKLLQARDRWPAAAAGVWLSAADFVAHRLCGAFGTDYSLAGRTFAFDLHGCAWDEPWLRQLGLSADAFPPALPAGSPLGRSAAVAGLPAGVPVAVCGHDHVCAAIGAGVAAPGTAFDSMGTAEALVGAAGELRLDAAAMASGLMFGLLPLAGGHFWMGGLSASGGSLDWLRGILGDPPLSYGALQALLARVGPGPGDLLYLPYLAGSGAPTPNPAARGAFLGLSAAHTRADLLRAVLEGAAFQLRAIRDAAAAVAGARITRIVAAGGGSRVAPWMQIKADVYGLPIAALAADEATLLGAALLAGAGCGLYATPAEALAVAAARPSATVAPDPERAAAYAERYETAFLPWSRLVAADTTRWS